MSEYCSGVEEQCSVYADPALDAQEQCRHYKTLLDTPRAVFALRKHCSYTQEQSPYRGTLLLGSGAEWGGLLLTLHALARTAS